MKIESVNSHYGVFEDAEIHLNTKGVFSLKLKKEVPGEYRYDQLPTSHTLEGIRDLIKEFERNRIRQKFVAKKIFLELGTSEKVEVYNADEKTGIFDEKSLPSVKGIGLYLNYAVVNEYIYKAKRIINCGVDQKQPWKTLTRYEWYDKTLYEIVGGTFKQINDNKVGEQRDVLFSLNTTHILEYSEETERYLIEITTALRDMVHKVTSFFNVKPELLIESLKANIGKKLLK